MPDSQDPSIHRLDEPGWPASSRRHIMERSEGTVMQGPCGIGVDDLVWIQRDQFVHYLGLARATHGAEGWPTFRQALLEALIAAFGLDHGTDGLGVRRAAALALLDTIRPIHDPVDDWHAFREALWARRHVIRPDLC